MVMKYKDYVFPSNPSVIRLEQGSSCHITPLPESSSVTENTSVKPAIVTGSGELFGDDGREACAYLQHMLKLKESGWLFAPAIAPLKAFLTEFTYEQRSDCNSFKYNFKFVEDSGTRQEQASLSYVTAVADENLFDIAHKYKISIDRLMQLNAFKTPFDINEGDRVVLI